MRPLRDVSLFERQKAVLRFRTRFSQTSEAGTRPDSEILMIPQTIYESDILSCRYLGESEIRNYFFQRRRASEFLSLEYIYEGEIYIRSGNGAYVAEAGDLCVLHPQCNNDLLCLPGVPCRKAGMIPCGTLLPDMLKSLHLEGIGVIRMEAELWNDIFERVKTEMRRIMDPRSRRRLAGVIFELLSLIAELHRTAPASPEMEAVRNRLERNFQEPFRMETLAAELGVSLPTFNTRFRASFGETPYQYLIRMRLLHAARLLGGSRLTVKEISQLCGYGNPFHFSTEFTRFHGCPPREFRRRSVSQRSRSSAE